MARNLQDNENPPKSDLPDYDARDEADPWQEWYRLTPMERIAESMKLWQFYLAAGGSLEA